MLGQLTQLSRIVPVHPIAKSLRLFCLSCRESENSTFAFVDEVVDAEFMDCRLGPESQLLLDFHFDPQPLTVEPVLVSLVMAGHREETLIRILVRSAPGVVNSHRIVGRDRPVQKAPAFAT